MYYFSAADGVAAFYRKKAEECEERMGRAAPVEAGKLRREAATWVAAAAILEDSNLCRDTHAETYTPPSAAKG